MAHHGTGSRSHQHVRAVLACLWPLLFGILKDATGGLGWPFAMLAMSVVVMLAGAWAACRPRFLEDVGAKR